MAKKHLFSMTTTKNRYLLEAVLLGSGCLTVAAANKADAPADALRSPLDMVISGVLMPVMDGYTCRKKNKNGRLQNLPFIFYTAANSEQKGWEFALNLGAESIIV